MENKENAEEPERRTELTVQASYKRELRGRLRATSERSKKLGETSQVVDSMEYTCAACQRNFTNLSGFRRHQKFCQGTKPAVSSVAVAVAKVEAFEAVAEADLEVGAVGDLTAPEVMDSTLRDKMKGVMLTKVNELIEETTATGPGKCHCCGEDLETWKKSLKIVAQFKYLENTLINQGGIHETITHRCSAGNACYHFVRKLLISHLLAV